jgi:crotonobetainyl-CoA:carnitine CoA-transferase CaiB-like acyl-CoA transferase
LRQDGGRAAFWKLLATADVFIDGNAADACDKLGIGYEAQKAHKPDIVFCQYSGFGSAGPYSPIPTHGQMMNALAAATPTAMGDDGFMHPMVPPPGRMGATASGGEGTAAGAVHAALHVAALRREIQSVIGARPLAEWTRLAAEHDIPVGPAYRYLTDARNDPHMATRNIFVEGHHPHAGPFTYVGEAAKVAGQDYEVRYPAPLLGEHTRELLREVGETDAGLDALAAAKVIKR